MDTKWVAFICTDNLFRNLKSGSLLYQEYWIAQSKSFDDNDFEKAESGGIKIDNRLFIKANHLTYKKISKICLDEGFPANLDLVFTLLQNVFSGSPLQIIIDMSFRNFTSFYRAKTNYAKNICI